MNTFEDDAVNNDFEIEITDLDPKEARPISSVIGMLRSRISFKARGDDDASPNDDFELEITDLPANDEERGIPAAIAALRSHISLSPHSEDAGDETSNNDFELEITDLPASDDEDSMISVGAGEVPIGVNRKDQGDRKGSPLLYTKQPSRPVEGETGRKLTPMGEVPGGLESLMRGGQRRKSNHSRLITNPGVLHSRLPRKVRMLRVATVGIAILIMLGVVLGSVPSARDAVLGLFPRPTPTPTPAIVRRGFGRVGSFYSGAIILGGDISISSTPIAGVKVIPWNPNTPVANVLNPPPQACPSANVPQDSDIVDYPYGNRVGSPPLWIMGFAGYFETIATLIDFTRANPPQYGWVRQVTLMLESNAYGPVTLQGAHLLDGTPLLFSDPDSGQGPSTFLTLTLDTSSISDAGNGVLGGIADIFLYIPAAGCYYLKASWAGGSWEVVFAAGQ